MVDVDFYQLAGIIIGVIVGVGTAVAFMVRANMRVNKLEGDLQRLERDFKNHPLLLAFSQMEHENLIATLNVILSNSRVERGDNG